MFEYQEKRFVIGSTTVCYLTDDSGATELRLIPTSACEDVVAHRDSLLPDPAVDHLPWKENLTPAALDSLVHMSIAGEPYAGGFSQGRTMRGSKTTRDLRFDSRESPSPNHIITRLVHPAGFSIEHNLEGKDDAPYLRIWCELINDSAEEIPVEMITSFSIGGITPFDSGQAIERLRAHRFRSTWSAEGRHESIAFEDLNLERSWIGHSVNCERFGQVGSMPVRGFFPVGAIEDSRSGVLWGAVLSWAGSWQMEFYRKDDFASFSGGLADREFGHWMKRIAPGERFVTPTAIVATVSGDIDTLCDALLEAQKSAADECPKSEDGLPVVFNEWCTSWGDPSHDSMVRIADRLAGTDIKYLVIDAGWYKRDGSEWGSSQGDWVVNRQLFPEGLLATSRAIRERGLIPGLWFEMEVVGSSADAYERTELLLHRDGMPLTVDGRRFWDLSNPHAVEYLSERVIGLLESAEMGYLKVDYNETIGIGCDGAESLGEGLRRHVEGVYSFFQRIRARLPELVIENCSSGGHRLEPSMMALTDMGSFSDAHESREIPIIAANLHRLILPIQSQIWAVLHADDSPARTRYSLVSGFLGRLCLSGEIWDLDETQFGMVADAIAFYQSITDILRYGTSRIKREISASYREPKGSQCVVRTSGSRVLAIVTVFERYDTGELRVSLPLKGLGIVSRFEGPELTASVQDDILVCQGSDSFCAAAYLLEPNRIQ
jgi:alpha-galactosidase